VVLSGSVLYGTASQGGSAKGGTLFKVNTDGTGFAVLYSFTPADQNTGPLMDGAFPLGDLVLAGNTIYGTTSGGGTAGNGTVFKINNDGTVYTTLHGFGATDPNTGANSDGSAPWAGLILSGNTLYGTATRGGDSGSGTVFKVNTDGNGFARLHSFTALDGTAQTNIDGAYPIGGLVMSNNTLYGTTYRGGSSGAGTVFAVGTDGTGFTNLNNADGGPRGTLVLSGNSLYGTTQNGGNSGHGSIFKVNLDGSGFTNLQSFGENTADGPWAGLSLNGTTLYGTTLLGGDSGQGSVFGINVDGTGFTNLYSFTGGLDGAQPQAAVTFAGGSLYGTTSQGGSSDDGTVFRLTVETVSSVELTIIRTGPNVVLSWPATAGGLILQSSTSLVPPVVWTAVTSAPVVVNGRNTVTTPISNTQSFYRLTR
jgi:uncharacterized repeat protein (TIGR03803 family)